MPVLHGRRPILGFRVGDFAYLTDCSGIPDASWPLLEGLDTLVIDALRHRPHPTHFTVEQALGVVGAPRRPRTLADAHLPRPAARGDQRLAAGRASRLAYDGLRIDI